MSPLIPCSSLEGSGRKFLCTISHPPSTTCQPLLVAAKKVSERGLVRLFGFYRNGPRAGDQKRGTHSKFRYKAITTVYKVNELTLENVKHLIDAWLWMHTCLFRGSLWGPQVSAASVQQGSGATAMGHAAESYWPTLV